MCRTEWAWDPVDAVVRESAIRSKTYAVPTKPTIRVSSDQDGRRDGIRAPDAPILIRYLKSIGGNSATTSTNFLSH